MSWLYNRNDEDDAKAAIENHNQGEKDAADDKFELPHSSFCAAIDQDDKDDNDSYIKGWENGQNQKP